MIGNNGSDRKTYWWVQPVLTCLIVGVGFAASYSSGKERLKAIGEKVDSLQAKGSDPLSDLKTRVSVLENRLDSYITRNDKDHEEIKSKLDQLIRLQMEKAKVTSVEASDNLPSIVSSPLPSLAVIP